MTYVAPSFSRDNKAVEKTCLLRSNKRVQQDCLVQDQHLKISCFPISWHYNPLESGVAKMISIQNCNKTYVVSGDNPNKESKCFKDNDSMRKQTVNNTLTMIYLYSTLPIKGTFIVQCIYVKE